jgi:hypothetical protein
LGAWKLEEEFSAGNLDMEQASILGQTVKDSCEIKKKQADQKLCKLLLNRMTKQNYNPKILKVGQQGT